MVMRTLGQLVQASSRISAAGVPLSRLNCVPAAIAAVEGDLLLNGLILVLSWLSGRAEAPPLAAVAASTLLSLVVTSSLGGDVGAELSRAALPLIAGAAISYISDELAADGADADEVEAGAAPADPTAEWWDARLERRMRSRKARNAALIERLVQTTRGISPAMGRALLEHCAGRDATKLTVEEWMGCRGVGETLAERIVEGVRCAEADEAPSLPRGD